jgi:hypothetical protein
MRKADDGDFLHSRVPQQDPSTSTDEMFSPPLMITSFRRS